MGPWQMNVSLQRQRKELSPRPYWPGMIYITAMALARSPVPHLSALHRKTQRTWICTGTQIHSISLKCLGSWSFSGGGGWCWGETVIRWTSEDSVPVVSGFLSGLWFAPTSESGYWEHENVSKYDKWVLEQVNLFIQIVVPSRASPSVTLWSLSCVVEGCRVWRSTQPAGKPKTVSQLAVCRSLVARCLSCLFVSVGAGLVPTCVFHQNSSHLPSPHPAALDHRTSRSTPH